ncbi:MAG TPA: lytic transglycosylase domain-containing protein, partial [Myxococcales bacterium]|nr:lytic transglycosylase domain-containing protein [Myxococcales bacterium]
MALTVAAALSPGAGVSGTTDDAALQGGSLLADGHAEQAASAVQTCGEPRCRLVLGRALFALGRPGEAAAAVQGVLGSLGTLEPHGLLLEGESLLLSGSATLALQPLREASAGDGPVALRASALLADALLASGDAPGALEAAKRAAALPGQPHEAQAAMAWDVAQALHAQPERAREAAQALRNFWLQHPEHPAAETARAMQRDLGVTLPDPSGRELLLRASRLLAAGHPAAAVAQAQIASGMLSGEDRAEALLLHARALAADGKRTEAGPSLEFAWTHGSGHVAAAAGMLLARDRARRGRDAEAIRLADALAKKFPSSSEAEESVLFTARLLMDAGKRPAARARLAKLAAKRTGANASLARWTLAWMSYEDHLRDAVERFSEFAASASSDEERAQGLYWQARAGKPEGAEALYRRVAELDPLGYYGLLARERLGASTGAPPPFPPQRMSAVAAPGPRLLLGMELASLGFLAEAAAEADWYVQRHPGDASAAALPVYERARRPDRAVLLALALIGDRGPRAPRALLDAAYPPAYVSQVGSASDRTGLDPYLLLAVMRRESLFKPDTRSSAGAVGLLQLLPATARRAATVLGRPALRDDELSDPGTAIDLGG